MLRDERMKRTEDSSFSGSSLTLRAAAFSLYRVEIGEGKAGLSRIFDGRDFMIANRKNRRKIISKALQLRWHHLNQTGNPPTSLRKRSPIVIETAPMHAVMTHGKR